MAFSSEKAYVFDFSEDHMRLFRSDTYYLTQGGAGPFYIMEENDAVAFLKYVFEYEKVDVKVHICTHNKYKVDCMDDLEDY